jgi:hypothetical protein
MEGAPNQESPEERQERIKFVISKFLEDKLTEAVELKKQSMEKGQDIDIVQILKDIWPENDGVPAIRRPKFTIPGLEEELTVRFEPLSTDYDDENKIMSLGIGRLREAETPEEMDKALIRLLEAAYHEPVHMYERDPGLDPGTTIQETIEYLGSPGEIEAHARQFAFRYIKEFPGQEFDIQKMIEYAQGSIDSGESNKPYNYFIAFADPIKQEKFKEFGDVKAINEKIVEATQKNFRILTEKMKQGD